MTDPLPVLPESWLDAQKMGPYEPTSALTFGNAGGGGHYCLATIYLYAIGRCFQVPQALSALLPSIRAAVLPCPRLQLNSTSSYPSACLSLCNLSVNCQPELSGNLTPVWKKSKASAGKAGIKRSGHVKLAPPWPSG